MTSSDSLPRANLLALRIAALIFVCWWPAGAVIVRPLHAEVPTGDGETVAMNFQGSVPLDALLGYLSGKLGIQYQFDPAIARREITLRTPDRVSVESLPILLGNVLRSQGLVLVDTEDPFIQRIVAASEMVAVATVQDHSTERFSSEDQAVRDNAVWGIGDLNEPDLSPTQAEPEHTWKDPKARKRELPPPRRPTRLTGKKPFATPIANPATPVTEVFALRHVEAAAIIDVLRPFASGSDANLKAVPGSNSLIITDYAGSIESLRRVIRTLDRPAPTATFSHYQCRHQNAAELADQATKMLRLSVGGNRAGSADGSVLLMPQPLENRIAIAGSPAQVEDAFRVLDRLDVATQVRTEAYRLRHVSAGRLATLFEAFSSPGEKTSSNFQITVDQPGNQLIVRGGPAVHQQIVDLIARTDIASTKEESPIRFYKLKNAVAAEVLESLLALAEVSGSSDGAIQLGIDGRRLDSVAKITPGPSERESTVYR